MEEKDKKNVMKLHKEVDFEGKKYTEIDLSGLDEMTTNDLIQARRLMVSSTGVYDLNPELTQEFACYLASIKTNLPYEFFVNMSAADGMELKRRVRNFLY